MNSSEHALKLFRERQEQATARLARAKQAEIDHEIEAAMRVTHRAIAATERRALAILNQRVGAGRAEALFGQWKSSPGLMTMASKSAPPLLTTSRPVSAQGRVSFHFDVRNVTTGGLIVELLDGRVPWRAIGRFRDPGSVAHQKYIEREDGVETLEAGDAADHQGYIERDGATEVAGRERSSWGTISPDPTERLEFWRALEEAENKPKPTIVNFDPAADPSVWAKAIRSRDFPVRISAEIAAGSRSLSVSEDEALAVFRAFGRAGVVASAKRNPTKPAPVQFELGRGGNVQTRMIVSLPHEMTARQRLALAQEYTAEFEHLGIPFWAVIHAPGKENDARNYHLHVNLATRPATKIPHPLTGEPVWDFSILATRTYANDTKRIIRPFAQNKIRAMNRPDWIPRERARFSKIANWHLEAGGYQKRLDPRTHEAMGLPPPREHLPKTDFGRERRGLTTPRGVKLATREWEGDVEAIAMAVQAGRQPQKQAERKSTHVDDPQSEAEAANTAYLHALSHLTLRIMSRIRLRPRGEWSDDDQEAEKLAEALDRELAEGLSQALRPAMQERGHEPARAAKPEIVITPDPAPEAPIELPPQDCTPEAPTQDKPRRAHPRNIRVPQQGLPSASEAKALLDALPAPSAEARQHTGSVGVPDKPPSKKPDKTPKQIERKRVMIARQRGGMER